MGAYISSKIGGRAFIGAWALKGTNMVLNKTIISLMLCYLNLITNLNSERE